MKLLIIVFMIGLICTVQGGYNCVQAFCSKEVAECQSDEGCRQNITKCSNNFKKQVGSAQKTGAYKGTEHALDDFNYCMMTNPKTKAINTCQAQHCNNKKTLIGLDIEIDQLTNLIG